MSKWIDICRLKDIAPNTGRCALIDGKQIAIFRVNVNSSDKAIDKDNNEKLYAINNHCPFSNANIISRGIIGSLKGQPMVASPLYKQHFDLNTGKCLEDDSIKIDTFSVRLEGDTIQLAS